MLASATVDGNSGMTHAQECGACLPDSTGSKSWPLSTLNCGCLPLDKAIQMWKFLFEFKRLKLRLLKRRFQKHSYAGAAPNSLGASLIFQNT